MAATWKLPLVWFIENNCYGVSTEIHRVTNTPDLASRAAAYDVPFAVVDGTDPVAVYEAMTTAMDHARSGKGPYVVEAKVYRYQGHYCGDPAVYRPAEYMENALANDAIEKLGKKLTTPDTGVLLGLQFPAGKALDELYPQADACMEYRVKLKDLTFSLSGMENQVKRLLAEGEAPANVARFTLDTVCSVVLRATQEAQRRCPGLPVLCSGGVASNRQLRAAMERSCGALFAKPCYSTDNAMGIAVLTALQEGV